MLLWLRLNKTIRRLGKRRKIILRYIAEVCNHIYIAMAANMGEFYSDDVSYY